MKRQKNGPPAAVREDEKQSGHRYGRGRFDAHPNYVRYMEMIVREAAFAGMPNAVSEGGRINWQVSSGRSTSFYRYYRARWEWWEARADVLELPGSGNERDRFSIAARRIHPTGYRACRLCGEDRNVGYFYLNRRLADRLNKLVKTPVFERGQAIPSVLAEIEGHDQQHGTELGRALSSFFPERSDAFDDLGLVPEAFEQTSYIRSAWLSPGYMANPPDRLDGFHDYCLHCRGGNDPGRSTENLRSYQHDRRAFEWWAEGDWFLADALYNAAGSGTCSICGAFVDIVSPDHVGPLACGFKQLPLFMPTCQGCNSSKNRRMRADDVLRLIEYEEQSGDSAASWQVRGLWDAHKHRVASDADAAELSAYMRGMQDAFLRALHTLRVAGEAQFLVSLLGPNYAFYSHDFEGLDPSTLTFDAVVTTKVETPLRQSLACRCVRIAFEELEVYVGKGISERKVKATFEAPVRDLAGAVVELARECGLSPIDQAWAQLIAELGSPDEDSATQIAKGIATLLGQTDSATRRKNKRLRAFLEAGFYRIGAETSLR